IWRRFYLGFLSFHPIISASSPKRRKLWLLRFLHTNVFVDAQTICHPPQAPVIWPFLESLFMRARDNLRRRLTVLGFLTLLIPAGCSYFRQASDPNILVFLMDSAPTNLDPRIGADAY